MSRILCIDDEPAIGAVLNDTLRSIGHEATVATSVKEGLEVLTQQTFELVISDVRMPRQTGFDLLDSMKRGGYSVPVILMTGYSSIEQASLAIKRGAVDYLTKPVRAETLRIAVNGALEVARLRRELDALQAPSHAGSRKTVTVKEETPVHEVSPGAQVADLPLNLKALETLTIKRALAATGGHRSRAAELLGISERTLRNKIKAFPRLLEHT